MDERVGTYQRARRKFAMIVYLVTVLWLLIALAQWLVVSLISDVKNVFTDYEWISVICFMLGIALTLIFIFFEQSRFVPVLNWVLTFVIVEFSTIGVFALVARSKWADMLMWYFVCLLLLFLFILVGAVLPHDLTLDVVIIFVISFVFLITSIFMLMLYVVTLAPYSFILYQLIVSIIILSFVMYHAQTITGGRFAEMRVNDYLLATIILFYDFIIIFLLTFYVQTKYRIASDALDPGNTTTEDGSDGTSIATTTAEARAAKAHAEII
ncbi:uncharacterized protein LOC133842767 [Drosophila sulfurigaster albostrigata]|uniref:uncharacterized protein LOC133842767 n=1 Tax=Drosophila sulfurigaster albostrigata TaxID=89887 RepID=UPI002D21C930|nr:uncharacterized protein LOC133842767 [Drosophila sulfurigaster albostrigata]